MTDTVIKGTGNSRSIKAAPATLPLTYDEFRAQFISSGIPIDLLGLNAAGLITKGTDLNKAFFNSLVPVGFITFFAKSQAPDGWLFCNGATVASADYQELYAVIGTMFGGNSANFALPDLRNRFPRGISSGLSPTTDLGKKYGATSIPVSPTSFVGKWGRMSPSNYDEINTTSVGYYYNAGGGESGMWSSDYVSVRPSNMGLLPCIKY